jgi:hypothetical protein
MTFRVAFVGTVKGIATVVGMTLGGVVFFAVVAALLYALSLLWHLLI